MVNNDIRNIVIVYDYANINGGAAKVAISEAVALSSRGYNTFYYSAVAPICDELNMSGVKVRCMYDSDINSKGKIKNSVKGIWNIKARKDFLEFLYSEKFDKSETIIHFHGWTKALSSSVISVAKKQGYKVAITLHDYFMICPNGGLYNYNTGDICTITPMTYKCFFCNCDKRSYLQKIWRVLRQIIQNRQTKNNFNISYISISALNNKIVRPYIGETKIYQLNNPVELGGEKIKKIEDNKSIIYVGRLSNEKGVELFCQAITHVSQNNSEFYGIIIGDGSIKKDLMHKYPTLKIVGWKKVKEVEEYIRNARALVLPSRWYEGAPLTVVEAMSVGLPCIVSDCTSAVELIDDGINGYYFKTGNVDSLENVIKKILNDSNAIRLHENLIKHFDILSYLTETHITRLIDIYNDILCSE